MTFQYKVAEKNFDKFNKVYLKFIKRNKELINQYADLMNQYNNMTLSEYLNHTDHFESDQDKINDIYNIGIRDEKMNSLRRRLEKIADYHLVYFKNFTDNMSFEQLIGVV
jgi:hypothetical protein